MGARAVGVTVLRSSWPEYVDRDFVLGLRARDGSPPCPDGLRVALRWIGDRRLTLEAALAEASAAIDSEHLAWALLALGVPGYGSGGGHGYGDGYGYGDGDGSGDGSSDGSGYGSGDGYSSNDGSGYGLGYGYGSGSGDGSGVGYGEGVDGVDHDG